MASKGVSVGVEITGDAKGFKASAEDAIKATDKLRQAAEKSKGGFSDFSKSMITVNQALGVVGKAADFAAKAFDVFKKVMESNQITGDALEVTLAGINEATNTLKQNLATSDFSVSLKDALEAGRDLAGVLDDIGDRNRSINIISAKNKYDMTVQQGILHDMSKTEKERIAAAKEINRIVESESKLRENMLNEAVQGFKDFDIKKYKLSQDEADLVQQYIRDYALYSKSQQEALTKAQDSTRKLGVLEQNNKDGIVRGLAYDIQKGKLTYELVQNTAAVIPELQKYIPLWRPINDLTDKHRDALAQVSIDWWNNKTAMQAYANSADRALGKIDKLVKPTEPGSKMSDAALRKFFPDAISAEKALIRWKKVYDDLVTEQTKVQTSGGKLTKADNDALSAAFLQLDAITDLVQAYRDEAEAIISANTAFKAYARSKNAPIGPQNNAGNAMGSPMPTSGTGGWQPDIDPKATERATQALKDQRAAVETLASSFESLGGAIGGVTGSWISYVSNILGTIPELIAQITALTVAHQVKAAAEAKDAEAGAASAVASIPIIGPILAIAAIASTVAALAAVPKFAQGGIVSGPTIAQVGEYAGAKSNPEVIAPLDKLKSMLGNTGGGEVVFEIRGDTLVGVLNNHNRRVKSYK